MRLLLKFTFIAVAICFAIISIPCTISARSVQQIEKPEIEIMPNIVVLALKHAPEGTSLLKVSGISSLDRLFAYYQIKKLERLTKETPKILYKTNQVQIDNIFFAYYASAFSPYEVAAALKKDPNVEFAEPKFIRHLYVQPNDSLFFAQYYLPLIKAPEAWESVKGEQGNVVIAIVDGGTDIYHTDLASNMWTNPKEIANNGIDDDQNGFIDDVHGARMYDKKGVPIRSSYLTAYGAHGTHTCGIASAVTNNSQGIAGVGWNVKIMPIHAGHITNENSIPYGFEGILYAIEEGADIISCSWGGVSRSEYESRIVEYAIQKGIVILGAYGNDYEYSETQYPAAYPGVYGVAATDENDRKASYSNYGYSVDFCAPGENILSTTPNSNYGYMSGTSMSTPIAAGVVALVKTLNPSWTGVQAAEQVRVSADNIDDLNPLYKGKLGKGRINAYRALQENWPSIRITKMFITNQDSIIKPGDRVKVSIRLKNYLASARNISLALSTKSSYVAITKENAAISSLSTLDEYTLNEAFEFQVANNAPSGHAIAFTLDIEAGTYRDTDHFILTILPSYGNISINHLATSVTNLGRIGFGDPNNSENGIGFKYMNGPNLLFEGAIIAGTGPDRISNAARALLSGGQQIHDQDFVVSQDGDVRIDTPGSRTSQESFATFEDKKAQIPMNIQIIQHTYAVDSGTFRNIILFHYIIQNQSTSLLDNFHFGLYFDWDMDGGTYETNIADYDPERQMGYVYDSGSGPDTYVGIRLLNPGDISYRAIYNDPTDPLNPSWGLHDGFTAQEKWQAISGGLTQTHAGPADVSNVIASGPYSIAANGTLELDFTFLAANDLAELQAQADSALILYRYLFSTNVSDGEKTPQPSQFILQQNYPNPFNSSTTIQYQLARPVWIDLSVYDVLGRRIKTLVDSRMPAGHFEAIWDGRDDEHRPVASGTYFYKLHSNEFTQIHKMILLQ